MSLTAYKKKRNFRRTPEPAPRALGKRHAHALRYLIQKHDASRLHYDFRLELDGTLKSWAVPKGPSLDPQKKVLAVQVEDHPVDYGNFEGIIPKGQYGGGTVLLWDRGTWTPLDDPREGLKHGKLRFELHGEKLHGQWSLVQMHGSAGEGDKNWLLIKHRDQFSSADDILQTQPDSVKTGRTLDKIAFDGNDQWDSKQGRVPPAGTSPKPRHTNGTKKSHHLPERITPQLAQLADHPPEGEEWLHEIKFDGYRLLAFIDNGKVTLRTRTSLDWTDKFAPLARALANLRADSAILDGEAVVLNEHGQSNFEALQQMFKSGKAENLRYFVFDLLFHDGTDLRHTPLLERKTRLRELLQGMPPAIAYSDHVRGHGTDVIAKACTMGIEGIVSKRFDAPYVSRRADSWLKSKCSQRQEFIIIGFTPSAKRTHAFRSLLLGYYDPHKRLVYGGRAGTGFDEAALRDLRAKLDSLRQEAPPTDLPPPKRERRDAHWVKPQLVCEVRFTGWTRDGVLRHPVYMGLRLDKPPSKVTREIPVHTPHQEETAVPTTNGRKHHGNGTTRNLRKPSPKSKRTAKSRTAPTVEPVTQTASAPGIRLTHPDRILYPADKITKADLVAYYQLVAPLILPHIVDRPLALVRCPGGLSGQCFFMRNWSSTLPPEIDKVQIAKGESHVMIHDLPGLLSLVQISALEIHPWNCRATDLEHPDQLIFDLDPGPGVAWKQVRIAAQSLRDLLTQLGMPAFLKTSGGKGLHLTIPIEPTVPWEQAKSFCKTLAAHQASLLDLFVINMRKELRRGKIYLDFLRNGRGATAIAPYGARARPGAAVSMPLAWEELSTLKSADQFTLANARRHLERRTADPWCDFAKSRVNLARVALGQTATTHTH